MNRRTFFMCGAGALWAQVPPSRQIVMGLIGAGARGMQMLHLLLADPSVRIGAVCETYEPRMFEAGALARSRGHSARYYRIYKDLLSDKSLDAVVIATPDFWHCRMTLEALAEGKDVYVEEPLCRTWQEGLAMIAAHGRSKQVVQAGSQRRSSPYFAQLASRVRASEFGAVKRIEGRAASSWLLWGVLQRGPTKLPEPLNFEDWQAGAETRVAYSADRFLNWKFYSAYGGGCVTGLGVPLLDGLHMLAGAGYPISVTAHGEMSKAAGFDAAGRAKIEIEYAGGVEASLSIDGTSARPVDAVRIHSYRGRIEANAKAAADATGSHLAEFLASVRTRAAPSAPPDAVFPPSLACLMANLSIATGRRCIGRPIRRRSRVEAAPVGAASIAASPAFLGAGFSGFRIHGLTSLCQIAHVHTDVLPFVFPDGQGANFQVATLDKLARGSGTGVRFRRPELALIPGSAGRLSRRLRETPRGYQRNEGQALHDSILTYLLPAAYLRESHLSPRSVPVLQGSAPQRHSDSRLRGFEKRTAKCAPDRAGLGEPDQVNLAFPRALDYT